MRAPGDDVAADLQTERVRVRVDYCELHCGGGEGVAADGDHMIRRAGFHAALDLEPDVVRGSSEGGNVQTLPNTTARRTVTNTMYMYM